MFNVAFWSSVIVSALMIGGIVWVMRRRPVGAPLTWGEAMVAAVYVFFLLFWIYGVVPHQFLVWADSELGWRPDRTFLQPRAHAAACSWSDGQCLRWPLPLTVSWQVVRDIVVVGIYLVYFGGNIALWMMWQNRGKKAATTAVERSEFGRPLVKEGGR